jgi:beta-lactam-binding protein with PASTA domain
VPDLAGKSVAEAQTALTAADCAAGAQTSKPLRLKKKTKKNRKKNKAIKAMVGKVTGQKTAAGETAVPGTAVDFEVGQLAKKKKHKKK